MLVYLTGVEMAYPFTTLYLTGRLGVSMSTVGLILGLTVVAGLPFQVVGGALADRPRAPPHPRSGRGRQRALYLALGLVHDLTLLCRLHRLGSRAGWPMFLTASNATIADLTPIERRTEAFGITRVAVNGGMVVGSPGRAPYSWPTPRSARRSCSAARSAAPSSSSSPWGSRRPDRRPSRVGGSAWRLRLSCSGTAGSLFCLVALLPLYGFGQIWSIFPSRSRAQGAAPKSWSRLLALYALTGTVLQYPVVRLVHRRDAMLLMACASVLIGVGLGGAVLVPFGWAKRGLFMAVAVGVMLFIPISTTVVSRLAPSDLRGRYMGAWTLVWLAGYALGPLFGGMALDTLGPREAYLLVALTGLGGGVSPPACDAAPPSQSKRRRPAGGRGVAESFRCARELPGPWARCTRAGRDGAPGVGRADPLEPPARGMRSRRMIRL
jgi:predicted MFS family arabinose efflux permease